MALAIEPNPTTGTGEVLIAAEKVCKYYGDDRSPVLDSVSLDLKSGEFIALLGPSGSGKSTLLRVLAGLMPPSEGRVLVHGDPLQGPNPRVAIVFQSFALFPWLTVLDNVELGLLASSISPAERRDRAQHAIELIGLAGFEEAFPKELSGGMKQRVGFARALVVQPEVLFMDEPFSALDVLTAENLRVELQDLWTERSIPTRSILLVTHNIDEAVSLADRILVFGANPGHIRVELKGLPAAERRQKNAARGRLFDTIYHVMTNPEEDAVSYVEQRAAPDEAPARVSAAVRPRRYQTLPDVGIDDLTGFVQYLATTVAGRGNVHELSRDLQMRTDDLLALVEATDLLGFADLQERQVILTPVGQRFADAPDVEEEKAIFREAALEHVSLLRYIVRELEASPTHTLEADRVTDDLEHSFSGEEARRQFETVVDWGRYAEFFTYDDSAGEIKLDEEHRVSSPS